MADVFVSYASQDREWVRGFVPLLEGRGWSVWWDRQILPGGRYHAAIEQALDEAKCVLVIWSEHSVRSDWVIAEADDGAKRHILVPVLINNVRLPLAFRGMQTADLNNWQGGTDHAGVQAVLASATKLLAAPTRAQEGASCCKDLATEWHVERIGKGRLTKLAKWKVFFGGGSCLIELKWKPFVGMIVYVDDKEVGRCTGQANSKVDFFLYFGGEVYPASLFPLCGRPGWKDALFSPAHTLTGWDLFPGIKHRLLIDDRLIFEG